MSDHQQHSRSRRGLVRPVAHVLALAPLDVWVRMIARSGGVHPQYWIRMGFILITSFVGTISTMHERVILSIVRKIKFGRDDVRVDHEPGAVVILGYYRSGTTHLHNLMSCDDRYVTPKWYQCLGGQGFWIGWSLIRFVLVPFLGSSRPQDAVGFGPSWPGEDDFALASWGGGSSIPGRFVWPSGWDDWKRWHGLEGLKDKELHRWRSLSAMYVWKLTRGKRNRSKIVLLKTPSHTARVKELDRLFGGNVRFVHLVREPGAVIDSNVRLHDALKEHLLEDEPDVQIVRDRIVEEYQYSEEKCRAELDGIDPDRWVRVRYQDLRNDEIGTLEKVYNELGFEWDARTKDSVSWYLSGVGDYRSEKREMDLGAINDVERAICDNMVDVYALDEPSVDRVEIEAREKETCRTLSGVICGVIVAFGCAMFWIGLIGLVHWIDESIKMRMIPLVWVSGLMIGWSVRKGSRNGTRSMGLYGAILTVLVVIGVAFPITVINYNYASSEGYSFGDWVYHNAKGGYQGLKSVSSLVLIGLGVMSAFRQGSANGPGLPGSR